MLAHGLPYCTLRKRSRLVILGHATTYSLEAFSCELLKKLLAIFDTRLSWFGPS